MVTSRLPYQTSASYPVEAEIFGSVNVKITTQIYLCLVVVVVVVDVVYLHLLSLILQFNQTGRGSVCSQAIMLVTDGATEMYDDVFEKYNWPERKVSLSLSLSLLCSTQGVVFSVICVLFLKVLLALHFPCRRDTC